VEFYGWIGGQTSPRPGEVASMDSDASSRQAFTAILSFSTHLWLLYSYTKLQIFHSYAIFQYCYISGK
jgi:hypothetical protein